MERCTKGGGDHEQKREEIVGVEECQKSEQGMIIADYKACWESMSETLLRDSVIFLVDLRITLFLVVFCSAQFV